MRLSMAEATERSSTTAEAVWLPQAKASILVTNPRVTEATRRCKAWLKGLLDADVRIVVPEIADYEVRRELLRAGRSQGVARLDRLAGQVGILAVSSATWRRAAELWAQARIGGYPPSVRWMHAFKSCGGRDSGQ
jgi:hypothetical protein